VFGKIQKQIEGLGVERKRPAIPLDDSGCGVELKSLEAN